ncbi:MAG: SHOCT domain-containing protein [Solirubrobacteraceae bacterium]
MGIIVGVVILGAIFFAFCQFVLGPILMWTKRRQIKAGVHSVSRAPDMNYQARLNAQALADELKRNAAETASRPSAPATVPSTNSLDLGSELKKLSELHQSGALTADEFQASKAKLLG